MGSRVYDGTIMLDDLYTIKAVAMKEDYNNSDVMTYQVPYLYAAPKLMLAEEGRLEEGVNFYGLSNEKELTITGSLNTEDFGVLRQMKGLESLNLTKAIPAGKTLADGALSGMNLKVVHLPAAVQTVGQRLLAECGQLSAVIWNAGTIPVGALAGINNPNLLLYVILEAFAANAKLDGINNIIMNGHAEQITLSDVSEGNNDFYCPQTFTVETMSYTHDYQMQTGIHECRGWETIALPFDVQTVTHETWGELTPAAINDPAKPLYWLYEYSEDGFVPAASIAANTPYIISMPNNPTYSNEYNLSGKLTLVLAM